MAVVVGLTAATAYSERYTQDVMLNGVVVPSEQVSGFRGTAFVIGVPDSGTNDDHAVFGLSSEEKRDHPCYVTVRTENVNDSSAKLDLKKDLCGGREKSQQIKVEYGDASYGKRSFVTGVRVCMNNDDTRVKGIQVRGKTITDDARLGDLEREVQGTGVGGLQRVAPEEPKDDRPHCNNNWKKWALCPTNQIATAVVLHFEGGKGPTIQRTDPWCRQSDKAVKVDERAFFTQGTCS
jgi:hypothetical protein